MEGEQKGTEDVADMEMASYAGSGVATTPAAVPVPGTLGSMVDDDSAVLGEGSAEEAAGGPENGMENQAQGRLDAVALEYKFRVRVPEQTPLPLAVCANHCFARRRRMSTAYWESR